MARNLAGELVDQGEQSVEIPGDILIVHDSENVLRASVKPELAFATQAP
jgi:hypothetical protein